MEVPVFGSQVLEVVIGLLLIYSALSVACSGIKEFIASVFALRSKTLGEAIRKMLQDANNDVVQRVLEHPVIAGTAAPGNKLPSYISSRNFALALLDAVAPVSGAIQPRTIQDLRAAVTNLPSPKLRKTLLGLIDSAQGDLTTAQDRIEHWFDDTMERVSGWYKRVAQRVIFAVGFVLCLALNADTFQVSKELWSEQTVRNAVVMEATQLARESKSVIPVSDSSAVPSAAKPTLVQLQQVSEAVRAAHPFPFGWSHDVHDIRTAILSWPGGLFKLLGILVTSLATLMGAPFWFDLLNKVINLRISGEPPAPAR
jgi:hypothetical protein